MKRIMQILAVAIAISSCLIMTRRVLTPVLMKNSNYGITSLEQNGTDILFIGSSLFRQGIDTKNLSTGQKSTYLLAYNGFQPFAEYITLKEVFKHTSIKCLVIDMDPYIVSREAKLSDARLFQDQSFGFIYELFSQIHKHGSADYYDLFEMIVQSNNETFFTWPLSYPFINERYYRGSKIGESASSTAEQLNNAELDKNHESELSSIQISALENIIELCRENNVEVIFLEAPKYKRVYENGTYSNLMQTYLQFLQDKNTRIIISNTTAEACSAPSYVEVYEFDSSDASLFNDLNHISSAGRNTFTQTLMPFFNNN